MNILVHFANWIISSIGTIAQAIILLLPTSPFTFDLSSASPYTALLFWLIPIPAILSLLAAYLPAVSIYYGLRILLRQIKMSGG